MLMMGETTEDELYEVFKRQAQAVERGGADACIIETMAAVDEASIAVRASKENTNIEVGCSFTYDTPTADGWRTNWGVTSVQAVAAALDAGADFIGANCSVGSDDMVEVVKALRDATPDTVILVHPNAGLPIQQDDGSVAYPETPEMMAANVPRLVEAGANIIGGCCGTTPDHIRAIRAAVLEALT
jgi:5-methyltetrahydrofolate--homocysteine methyltransferase